MKYYGFFLCLAIGIGIALGTDVVGFAAPAAQEAAAGGYLSGYQEAAAQPERTSAWTTFAYLFSLLIVFVVVALLAYFASRFIGGRFSQGQNGNNSRILENMPLGANRSVCVVEIAGKVMLLGVTEQRVTLLQEITDELEISKLRSAAGNHRADDNFQQIFEKQLVSLSRLSKKIPALLNEKRDRK